MALTLAAIAGHVGHLLRHDSIPDNAFSEIRASIATLYHPNLSLDTNEEGPSIWMGLFFSQ